MRWFVSMNAESSGPHEERLVAEWARTNQLRDAMLRDEAASAWVPLSQTPFRVLVPPPAPQPVAATVVEQTHLLNVLCARARQLEQSGSVVRAATPLGDQKRLLAPQAKPPNVLRALLLIAAGPVLVSLFLWDSCSSSAHQTSAAAPPTLPAIAPIAHTPSLAESSVEAWVMAKHVVTSSLKSPSTADFGSILGGTYQGSTDHCSPLGDGAWTCRGWVDAQNGFGATMRTNFWISLKHDARGWVVTDGPNLSEH